MDTYLDKHEWSMGNGQCPCCFGLSPGDFWPSFGITIIGHKQGCSLAKQIEDIGGSPIYQGDLN